MTDNATKKPARPGTPKPPRRADALAGFTPPVATPPTATEQPERPPMPTQPAPAPVPPAAPALATPVAEPPAPAAPVPVSNLANLLTGGGQSPAEPAAAPNGEADAGLMHALLGGSRPVDPMKDLVGLGTRVPRHYKEGLRLAAFAQGTTEQDLMQKALELLLGPDLIAHALAASRSRPR